MKLAWQCMFSPRLYKIYGEGPREALYRREWTERWGDNIISMATTLINIGFYTSPLLCLYFYKRGLYTVEESYSLIQCLGGVSCMIALSYILRAYGRSNSPKYVEFLNALSSPQIDPKAYLQVIRKYDFEFHAWPVSYKMPPIKSDSWIPSPFERCANDDLPIYQRSVLQVLAYLATHTFALRLIYPGSLAIFQNLLRAPLFQGRTHLVESFHGQRNKIETADGNFIDTMFVEQRSHGSKGKILVICCEGNSGFYEIGIMTTPIKAGYSALGWNHPGFAASTGLPYPKQEENAMDAVMRFAINELGFEPQQIVLFGWSIGGYSASWAAVNYPEVKALILDATFDDLLPLACNQMPSSWGLLVKEVVRSYVDLDVARLVESYAGPVQLIRRTEDEIICLRQGQLASNRANDLVVRIITSRHPELPTTAFEALRKHVSLLESQRGALERTDLDEATKVPIRLISKYMRDYRSSHCTPLPEEQFEIAMHNVPSMESLGE